jgi:hypothetical protein
MNGEQVAFSSHDMLSLLDSRPRIRSGHVPEGKRPSPEVYELLKGDFGALLDRVAELRGKSIGQDPIVPTDAQDTLNTFVVPKGYLYFRLDWPTPPMGLSVSVQFRKPHRKPDQ